MIARTPAVLFMAELQAAPRVCDAQSNKDRKVVVTSKPKSPSSLTIPDDILNNGKLNSLIKAWLPENYNFEVHKTIWAIRRNSYKSVALQMPEGLQRWAMPLSDLIGEFGDCTVTILAEQTYGACCIDDMLAEELGCEFIVHYGHSCLIPVAEMLVKAMYVFVEIDFEHSHLVECLLENFKDNEVRMALIGTIQFNTVLHRVFKEMKSLGYANMFVPQARPLSAGEVLGCTAPRLAPSTECIVYIGDGRFHLEAAMLANPMIRAYRYDPYHKRITTEGYDHEAMRAIRTAAVEAARSADSFGIIISTLGRQGSPKIAEDLRLKIAAAGRSVRVCMMPEIKPEILSAITGVDVWVQVGCPRLSIDWGYAFSQPLLSPFELNVALGHAAMPVDFYPMDYYAHDTEGPWANYYFAKKNNNKN